MIRLLCLGRVLLLGQFITVLSIGCVAWAEGQAPGIRVSVDLLRDSLSTMDDVSAVEKLAGQFRAVAVNRDDPGFALRHGFACLRLARLGQGHRSREAVQAFQLAGRLEPRWPLAWYGLGLAKLALARWQLETPQNIGFRVGAGALEEALQSFAKATELDPLFEPALVELARVALRLRSPRFLDRARESFRRARRFGVEPDAQVLLWWGRLERRGGNADSSRVAFAAYLVHGGHPGLGHLEAARTRLAHGLDGGSALYYTGAAFDDRVSIREYRADLALVADSTELVAFDRAQGPERAAMLRQFWTERDHRELRAEGERLREHYVRVHFARTYFYLENTRRHYWQAEPYRSGSDEFDDRAIIYIRHGQPSERVTPFVYALTGNESWRYDRPDGDLFFHFTVREDLRDYRLASSIFDLKSTGATPEDQLIMSRQNISPLYSKLGAWGPFGRAKLRSRERAMGEASIAEGTVTDSHALQFDDSLGIRPQVLAVGRAGENSLIHIALALTGLRASEEREAPSQASVRVRFAVFDARGRRVAGLDSNSVTVTRGHDGARFFGRVSLAAPPGQWRYRLAVQYGARQGTLLPWDSISVGRFDGTDLQVSDLMLGTMQAPLRWRPTIRDTAYIDPSGVFPRDGRVELYYEVYGLERGQPYRTVLEIIQDRPVLHLEFEERAQSDVSAVRRTLDLLGLEPGSYRIRVEAIDQRGRSHHATAPLRILER